MLYAILFSIFSISLGAAALSFLDKDKRFGVFSRWIFSLVLGFTLQGFVALVLALVIKNLELGAWITLGISVTATLVSLRVKRSNPFQYLRLPRSRWSLAMTVTSIFLLFITAIVLLLAYESMIWVDGFPYGILKGWGDGAYHMDMIRVLAESNPFALNHPVAGGTPLTYTFFINFLSALFLKLGSIFALAWHLPLFVYGIGVVAGLWSTGKALLKKNVLRIVFVTIVLFGGGLGIFLAPPTTNDHSFVTSLWDRVAHPQYEYTHLDIRTGGRPAEKELDKNVVWITPAISFFSHQRSFMPGAALFFLFLSGIFAYWTKTRTSADYTRNHAEKKSNSSPDHFFWWWFVIAGLIPLSHLHTAVAAGVFGVVIFLFHFSFRRSRTSPDRSSASWLHIIIPILIALVIASPQIFYLLSNSIFSHPSTSSGQANPSSLSLWFGWMTCAHNTSWLHCDPNTVGTDTSALWFWLKNFGIVFAAWVVSFVFIKKIIKTPPVFTVFVSGTLIFILGNLIKFQPWEFDNNKLLFYWWFAAALVFVFLLEKLFEATRSRSSTSVWGSRTSLGLRYVLYAVSSALIIVSLISGAVDVSARAKLWTQPDINVSHFGYYGNEIKGAADFIQKNTPSSAVFVASSGANQFIPMTTGRSLYLGFEGWLWTQGRAETGAERRRDIRIFLQTGDPGILCEKGADYLYADAAFRQEYAEFIRKNISFLKTQPLYSDPYGTLYRFVCE